MIKFVHINNHQHNSRLTPKWNQPSYTIAYEDDEDRNTEGQSYIKIAIAKCSARDQFNKATGRKIATQRMENLDYQIFSPALFLGSGGSGLTIPLIKQLKMSLHHHRLVFTDRTGQVHKA